MASQNFWSNLLKLYPEKTPDPEPDPTPNSIAELLKHGHAPQAAQTPNPVPNGGPQAAQVAGDPANEGWASKLGGLLGLHHSGSAGASTAPAPAPADPASSGPGWFSRIEHSLGSLLSLQHPGSAPDPQAPNPALNDPLPSAASIEKRYGGQGPGKNARAGRAMIAPPKPPQGQMANGSAANQAAVNARDTTSIAAPPIDATSLPDPGALSAQMAQKLPQVAPRSGQTREASVDEQVGQNQKSARTSWAGADQMKQITDSIMNLPMIQDQMKQNEMHKQLLSLTMAANPSRLDLSPLAAVADSWVQNEKKGNQSNLAASAMDMYKGRQLKQNQLEQGLKDIDQDQNNLSNTVLKASQDFKNGQDMKDAYSKLNEKASDKNADPFGHMNPLQALTTVSHLVDRGMNSPKDQQEAQDIRNLQGMLADGSAVTDRNFPLTLAKVVGGSGRIAAYEVAREAGSPELARQFDQIWGTLANGRITPENMRDYANFVNMLAQNHLAYRNIQAKRYAGIAPRFGLTDDDTNALLPGSFVHDVGTGVAPGSGHGRTNVGGGGVKPSVDALIQKFLQQKASQGGK